MTDTNPTPAETGSTEITRFNALKHGVLSRYTVLPWEDVDEYRTLVVALAAEIWNVEQSQAGYGAQPFVASCIPHHRARLCAD
jgi:hypothetical protein